MKHPFLMVEKGFVPVAQLKLGMHVVEAGNRTGVVTGWKCVPGVQTMYNLEVTQYHTYTVGIEHWIVHNCESENADANGSPDSGNIVPGQSNLYYGQQVNDLQLEGEEYFLLTKKNMIPDKEICHAKENHLSESITLCDRGISRKDSDRNYASTSHY